MNKNTLQIFTTVFASFFIAVMVTHAWSAPTASPPGANVSAPINVSGNPQTKIGNLGIGISGLPSIEAWTTSGWGQILQLPNGNALKWQADAQGWRHGIGATTGGTYFFRTASDNNSTPALYDMVINNDGNVSINGLYVNNDISAHDYFVRSVGKYVSQINGGMQYVGSCTAVANAIRRGPVLGVNCSVSGATILLLSAYDSELGFPHTGDTRTDCYIQNQGSGWVYGVVDAITDSTSSCTWAGFRQ